MVRQTKRRAKFAFGQPAVHLVETDQIEAGAPQIADHVLEEARRHLEQPVGLEPVEPGRPHVVQRQDRADSGDEWPQKMVRGAEIERLEAAADDGFLQAGQCANPRSKPGISQLFIDNCLPRSPAGSTGGASGLLSRAFGMDIAVSYRPGREGVVSGARCARAGDGRRVEVFEDMAAAEPFWRRLEDGRALSTPYQRFDLLAAWQRHVGAQHRGRAVHRHRLRHRRRAGLSLAVRSQQIGPAQRRAIPRLQARQFQSSDFGAATSSRQSAPADIRDIFEPVAAGGHRVDLAALFSQPLELGRDRQPVPACCRTSPPVDISARLQL